MLIMLINQSQPNSIVFNELYGKTERYKISMIKRFDLNEP